MKGDRRVRLDDFNDVASAEAAEAAALAAENGRVFRDAYEFAAEETEPPVPLWGTPEVAVIPAGGLCLLAGRPAAGKTTAVLDLVCHLVAGKPWPPRDGERGPAPWPTPRPLRVAIVENEGPIEMFRSKLKDKLDRFPVDLRKEGGKLVVSTFRWGAFSFADPAVAKAASAELDDEGIDLVVGDPLSSLGPEGVGSPAETLAFVQSLRPLGLGTRRAFLFLHHFRERVEREDDEMKKLSGAWGPHLDTLLALAATGHADQARLTFGKLRWARQKEPSPLILGRVWATSSFETLGEEGDAATLEPLIYAYLLELRETGGGKGGLGYALAREIAAGLGPGHGEKRVQKTLDDSAHVFELLDKERTKELGSRGKLWGLTEWGEVPTKEQRRLRLVEEPEPLEGEPE